MKAIIKNSLDLTLDAQGISKICIINELSGGSDEQYLPDDSETDPTGAQFTVTDCEQKIFNLVDGNSFDRDIMTLLQTSPSDITGILIKCDYTDDQNLPVAVRFDVGLQLDTMASIVELGNMSNFQMMNIFDSKITKLNISNVVIPADVEANLIILVLSKTNNS